MPTAEKQAQPRPTEIVASVLAAHYNSGAGHGVAVAAIRELRAAGYAIVPVEATAQMVNAGNDEMWRASDRGWIPAQPQPAKVWRAMVAAST